MQKLIPVINKLQDVFNSVGIRQQKIDLPQIAVVGDQSSGKSSVLEALVGHDFLPRGNNIVTRRPLVLQLVNTKGEMKADLLDQLLEGRKIEYPKKFTDYKEIRKAIEFVTDKACPDKAISDHPIRLRIQSPDVIDLTLVDLPGITKVPVGNQPKNIETLIKRMVTAYISKKNCIILAISAANGDIANSEGVRMAKEIDPSGDRTLGVMTKLDIVDKGTDVYDILTGKILPFKHGYVGVVNRCQADIIANKPIKEALKEERRFFASHAKYQGIASRQGIPFLSQKLNQILLIHIRRVLPELREKIDNLLEHARERLIKYGTPIDENMGLKSYLLQLITKFSTEYTDAIEGKNVDETQELFGGARINYIFYKKYIPSLSSLDPTKNLSNYDIKLRIQISKGTKTTLYIPETAFESLVKMQVKRLELPSLHCCDLVLNELVGIIDHCVKPLARFPELKDKMKMYAVSLLREYMNPLKEHIKNMIKCETSYINTNHPDFFGGGTKVLMLMEKIRGQRSGPSSPPPSSLPLPSRERDSERSSSSRSSSGRRRHESSSSVDPLRKRKTDLGGPSSKENEKEEDIYDYNPPSRSSNNSDSYSSSSRNQSPMDREKMEVEVIRTLLAQYFEIVRKQIADGVPKSIMHFLVNMSCKNLHAELIRGLYTEAKTEEMLKENDEIKQKRKSTQKMLNILLKAKEVLEEIRDIDLN